MEPIREHLFTKTGWEIIETAYDPEQSVHAGSLFLIGNGYLGYRGTLVEDGKEAYSGCFVTDTWDKADGKWEELCNVPNALKTTLSVDGEAVSYKTGAVEGFFRSLDLSRGLFKAGFSRRISSGKLVRLEEQRFSSLLNRHVIPMRYTISVDQPCRISLKTGIDGDVWNLNGQHLKTFHAVHEDGMLIMNVITYEKAQKIVVLESCAFDIDHLAESVSIGENSAFRTLAFDISPDQPVTMTKYMLVVHSNESDDPFKSAYEMAVSLDYDLLLQQQEKDWKEKWDRFDIEIEGDLVDQVAVRFNTYHSVIATPTHQPLPIGARGLSCQAYQGAAFWDQEIYNLPMFLYTDPKTCRNILDYRYITLDGARRKAQKLGYEGAFYAWISGKTGDELCPDFFFKDVNTGRPIRNHFNAWQIHISPDIAYTIWLYYQVTGDWDFILHHGAEIILEVARFLSSRVVFKNRKDRYELMKLQGPDEYHENVENNAFTNYQTFHTLEIAKSIIDLMQKDHLPEWESIVERIGLEAWEIDLWEDMLQKLYLPKPDENGVIEQFDGYFDLEEILPASKIKERLIREDEYYGWPVGVAVFTQVIKQADVIQLFMLHPEWFEQPIIKANYDYYEPRTLHFSSLSPSAYSIVASRANYRSEAYHTFQKSIHIDLKNTNEPISGGTFIGGIHTAATGVAWQMVVLGFAGFRVKSNGALFFEPRIPHTWKGISFYLNIRDIAFQVTITHDILTIEVDAQGKDLPEIDLSGQTYSLEAGTNTIPLNA